MSSKFQLFGDDFWENYRKNFIKAFDVKIEVPTIKLNVPEIKLINFEKNLFSEKLLDELKNINNLNFDIVNKALKILRYEYVKSFLYRTEPRTVIKYESVISDMVNHYEHVTNVECENVIGDSNVGDDIHKATPKLISFIIGEISGSVSNFLDPTVDYLAKELLPFIPFELRPFCFWVIVFLVVVKKPDLND